MRRFPVAILAYGSLLTDPGAELASWLVSHSEPVPTPFPVEYARTTPRRSGAPTLTVAPHGAPVQARLLLLDPPEPEAVIHALYRRELNRVGELHLLHDATRPIIDRADPADLATTTLEPDALVLYAALPANFDAVNDPALAPHTRAQLLARRAIDSVTPDTYPTGRDGIQYLADAIDAGIRTALTPHYRQAILDLTGQPTLHRARDHVAKNRDLH